MNDSEGIPDSEGIELTRTAGSKAKLLERGANLRERIFGRALAREVSVGRYSAGTPNNPRRMRLKVFVKQNSINTLGISKTTILWSLIFILNYNGISIILECLTGI